MDFRKDEIEQPENSDDEVDVTIKNPNMPFDEQELVPTIENVSMLAQEIEDKMNRITNTLRGIDKRMCVNLRYIASVVMLTEHIFNNNNQYTMENMSSNSKDKDLS